MIYELKDAYVKPKFDYINNMGSYNHLPEPFKEVDIEKFWHMYFIYSYEGLEFRQIWLTPERKGPIYSAKIHYFHNKAFALVRIGEEIKCFEIGCDHDYKDMSNEMCYHKLVCQKCGNVFAYDSSD